MNECTCDRADDWHYARCRSLDSATVVSTHEGINSLYRNAHYGEMFVAAKT
ncbi:hypothetical protein MINTMi27_15550 [Mycobacterium intracellulare]|nr:hypothetical protein MINTMi27_15550 [Mycobacterium intracellulare]